MLEPGTKLVDFSGNRYLLGSPYGDGFRSRRVKISRVSNSQCRGGVEVLSYFLGTTGQIVDLISTSKYVNLNKLQGILFVNGK